MFAVPHYVTEFIAKNAFVTGAIAVAASGYLMSNISALPGKIKSLISWIFSYSVIIKKPDPLYFRLEEFLENKSEVFKHGVGSLVTRFKKETVKLSAATGERKILWYKGLVYIHKISPDVSPVGPLDGRMLEALKQERYEINFVSFTKNIASDYLDYVCQNSKPKVNTEHVNVFINDQNWWADQFIVTPRKLDSIIMPDDLHYNLVDEIETFQAAEQTYLDLGIPHRRGYLFYGPPGTGKSSLALALASHFQTDMYVLDFRQISNKSVLTRLFNRPKAGSIIFLEDIDCLFDNETEAGGTRDLDFKIRFSLSDLLNVMDGCLANPGLILIMTTNFVDKLDDALIRTGRIDKKIKLDYATKDQIIKFYLRFFEDSDRSVAIHFAETIWRENLKMSDVQEALLQLKFVEKQMQADPELEMCNV
jgi:hypothetical protein